MSSMRETLERASEVKPIAEKNGVKYVSYEDAVVLQQEQLIAEKLGENFDLGDREINPDGTVAKSKTTVVAMNEERRLLNRYRVVTKQGGKKLLQVVTDYRAIKEQGVGAIYTSAVNCFEFDRVDGELRLIGTRMVGSDEFVAKFMGTLDKKAMYEVLGAISNNAEDISADEMPI